MIRISAVSYLNTLPFIYGLQTSNLVDSICLELDYPSVCADKLISGRVDVALVPIITVAALESSYIVSDYCIGSNGLVDTVCLYSDVPIYEVKNIFLDYQSRTSVGLLKILLKEYWKINPTLKNSFPGFEQNIGGRDAGLVIGDRAFDLNGKYKYVYDLSFIWKEMTGLPFVFALWVSTSKLSKEFINDFNNALLKGVLDIDNSLSYKGIYDYNCENPKEYLENKISYFLDSEKKKGMALFLRKVEANLFSFLHLLFLLPLHLF